MRSPKFIGLLLALFAVLAATVAPGGVASAQGDSPPPYVDLVVHFEPTKSTLASLAMRLWFENQGTATAYDVEIVILARGNAGANLDIIPRDQKFVQSGLRFNEATSTLRATRMEPGKVYEYGFTLPNPGTSNSQKVVAISAEISSQVSYESPAKMHDNVARAWHVFSDGDLPQVRPDYSVTVMTEEYPLETDRLDLLVTARTGRDRRGALLDARVNVELPPGLEVDSSGSATFAGTDLTGVALSPSSGKSLDDLSWQDGVFHIGETLDGEEFRMTLPVQVTAGAFSGEPPCVTATITADPPTGHGDYRDDPRDNVARACLGAAPAGEEVVLDIDSGTGDLFTVDLFTWWDCVGKSGPPCDRKDDGDATTNDDLQLVALAGTGGEDFGIIQPSQVLVHIPHPAGQTESRIGELVWSTGFENWGDTNGAYNCNTAELCLGGNEDRPGPILQFNTTRLDLRTVTDGSETPPDVDRWGTPDTTWTAYERGYFKLVMSGPGKMSTLDRSSTGPASKWGSSPDGYEDDAWIAGGDGHSGYEDNFYIEFSRLGTYELTATIRTPYDDDVTDTTAGVEHTDTETYTFHVGPVAGLEVKDGGANSRVASDRSALTVVAANNGPDDASNARVTGLPTGAEIIRIDQGRYDPSAGEWNIGELKHRDYLRSGGHPDHVTLVLSASPGDTARVVIENVDNEYTVCINSDYVTLAHTNRADCKADSTTTNVWHAAVCVDTSTLRINSTHTTETACTTAGLTWSINICASDIGRVWAGRNEPECDGWFQGTVYDPSGDNTAKISAARGAGGVGPGIPGNPRTSTGTTAVAWDPVEYLYGLPVARYEVQWLGNSWAALDRPVAGTRHVDTAPSGRRDYRVRAVNAAGVAGPWSRSSATVQAGHAGPPVNLRTQADGNNAIDVSWDAPEDVGGSAVTGYTVQWSSDGTSGWSNAGATVDQTFTQRGLQTGAVRWYRVAARNNSGLGLWSDSVMGQTVLGVPDAPRSLSAQAIKAASEDAVWLTWTAPARDNGSPIEGYEVEGSLDGIDWTGLGSTDGKSATDLVDYGSVLWFEPGQARHYRVRALNEVGDGQWSSTARVSSAAVPPEGMSAWAEPNGQNAIDIFWGEPHLKGAATISSYEVQVCVPPKECTALNNDSDYSRVASPSGTTLSYTHTGLQPGDERYYRVRARNSAGWSEWSWPTSATTLDLGLDTGLPAAPRLTARANGSSEIKLSWTAADARGSEIESYELEVSGDGLYWDRLAYNWPDQTDFLHDGLDGGTRNYYRVRALVLHEGRHIGGQWSTVVNATTVAGAPAEPLSLSGEGVAQASDDSKHDHVVLTLKIRADSTITRYQVERSVDGGNSGWKQVSASKSASTSEDCTIDGTQTKCETVTLKDNTRDLFPGTYYYYRVAAVNSKGIGPYAYANVLTAGDWIHAPSRPRLLALSNVGRTAATVTWIEPEDDGGVAVTGYEYQLVRICGAGETEDCGDWPQDEDGFDEVRATTAKSVRLSGLESGGGYHFRVRAVNRAEEITGKGNWSHDIYIDLSAN